MLIHKKGNSIYLKAAYEDRDKVRSKVKGVEWDAHNKCWKVPASISTYRNLMVLEPKLLNPNSLTPEIREWINSTKALALRLRELQRGEGRDVTFPDGFEIPVKPFKHQAQAAGFCINLPKSALWLDLGLGKTYTSILVSRLRYFLDQIFKILVVCPMSLMNQWADEIRKYSLKDEYRVFIVRGTPTKKRAIIEEYLSAPKDRMNYLIITYESLAPFVDTLAHGPDMFILDESTKIKNPKAIRTINTVELCDTIKYGLELTGLAYLNNPVDLFSQFQALDTTVYGDNQWGFANHYIDFFRASFGKGIRGYKNMDELKSRAYYLAFSRTKSECVDLPEKIYTRRSLPMFDSQKQWYDKLAGEVLGEVEINGTKVNAPGVLARMEKLQQVLSGFIYDDSKGLTWLDSPKYNEMCDIVEDSRENFIIWANHTIVLDKIKEALTARKIHAEILSNKVKPELKDGYIREFKAGRLRVLICQLESESKGLNLTSEKPVNTIYMENTFSVDRRWQSESRCHRIGMTGTATYIDLIIEDSLDEGIKLVLEGNLKVSEYIARFGMDILLGKGGSVVKRSTKMKRRKTKEDEEIDSIEVDEDALKGLEGFD